MDIFDALASTTDATTFSSTTGYSMHDYAAFAKGLTIQFVGAPVLFVQQNGWKVVSFGAIIFILAISVRLFSTFNSHRPARR